MIVAPPRLTMPKNTSSGGPLNVISNPSLSR